MTDFTDLAQDPDRGHLADAGSAHDQGAGKHARQVIAAGPVVVVGAPGAAAILRTGTDSPVSSDSSACRRWGLRHFLQAAHRGQLALAEVALLGLA